MYRRMNGWINEWMGVCINEWIYGGIDEWNKLT